MSLPEEVSKRLEEKVRSKSDAELILMLKKGPRSLSADALRFARDEAVARGGDVRDQAETLFPKLIPSRNKTSLFYPLLAVGGGLIFGIPAGALMASSAFGFSKFDKPPEGYVRVGGRNPLGACFVCGIPFIAGAVAHLFVIIPLKARCSLVSKPPALAAFCWTGFALGIVAGMILAVIGLSK